MPRDQPNTNRSGRACRPLTPLTQGTKNPRIVTVARGSKISGTGVTRAGARMSPSQDMEPGGKSPPSYPEPQGT
ncbi:uncharacterized protein BDV14DRAFT_167485 [Aspergillus stella-maris]|uniref:uncharacterized protein n=1 Tax=Aspergillus stella-maris TaxID=1810926 RepID=UPI003CCDD50F